MVHFGVYTRVVMKALMEFNRRYIAKKLVFAVFDLPLGLIWKGGGSSISSVNMVQTVPNITIYYTNYLTCSDSKLYPTN